MRYVLIILGAVGLVLGFLMFANAHHDSESIAQATVVVLLGGVFLAIGMAATDIVEAIKGSRRS